MVAASAAAFAAGAVGLSLVRGSEGWESTAVVREAPAGEPLRSAAVARRALDAAGAGGEEAGELLDHLSAARSGGAAEFTVRADQPGAARRLAGSYARAWAAEVRPSSVPAASTPVSTDRDTARAALIGAAIGLLAGLLLAFLRERLDVRRTSSRSVAEGLGLAELGGFPMCPQGWRRPTACLRSSRRTGRPPRSTSGWRQGSPARHGRGPPAWWPSAERWPRTAASRWRPAWRRRWRRKGEGWPSWSSTRPARPCVASSRWRAETERRRCPAARRRWTRRSRTCRAWAVCRCSRRAPGPRPMARRPRTWSRPFGSGSTWWWWRPRRCSAEGERLPGVDALVLAVALRRTRRSRRPRFERVLAGLDVPVLGFVLMASAGGSRPGAPPGSAQRAPDLAAGGSQARDHDRQQYQ